MRRDRRIAVRPTQHEQTHSSRVQHKRTCSLQRNHNGVKWQRDTLKHLYEAAQSAPHHTRPPRENGNIRWRPPALLRLRARRGATCSVGITGVHVAADAAEEFVREGLQGDAVRARVALGQQEHGADVTTHGRCHNVHAPEGDAGHSRPLHNSGEKVDGCTNKRAKERSAHSEKR